MGSHALAREVSLLPGPATSLVNERILSISSQCVARLGLA